MPLSSLPRLLAATGRQGTRAVAASIFIGLVLPSLATAAKPLLLPCIVVLLAISFMRTDVAHMRRSRHAGVLVLALVWIMGILPAVLGFILNRLLPPSDNGVMLALVMQAAAPPIMSTPAFATLLGLDATLSLGLMVLSLCALPFTAPLLVSAFSDGALAMDGWALATRLGLILAGTAAAGFLGRAAFGAPRLARWNDHLNGMNVLLLVVLAVAFMDGVTPRLVTDPLLVVWLAGIAALVSICGLLVTLFAFRWVGKGQDLMLAYAAGNRNLGIMVAAAGGILPDTTWLYVAVAQFPVYLLPYLLRPLAVRFLSRADQG